MGPIANRKFTVSAPGRVCLFGEHQDYLGMPSIVMAINLRCRIEIEERDDRLVCWSSPKLGPEYSGQIDLDDLHNLEPTLPNGEQNHKLSALILAERRGELPLKGWNATIDSDIPVKAGCSSSSALLVAWIAGMQRLSGHLTSSKELADLAFEAEVTYFDAPGGNMDQIACAVGGPLRVDPSEALGYKELSSIDFDFVLGDSNAPKDTMGILRRCKFDRLDILEENGGVWDTINTGKLSPEDAEKVLGTIRNRDLEVEAAEMLVSGDFSAEVIGEMMNEHHSILRDVLKISTDRIEAMCSGALEAGAVGAKIFGSGGGGCMIALVPRNGGESDSATISKVMKAIENVDGAIAHHVRSEPGVCWGENSVNNPVVILAAGASSRMKKVEGVASEVAQEVVSRPKAMLRVGEGGVPFLDLLIRRIKSEGSTDVVVVINEKDTVTEPYFKMNPVEGVRVSFVVQTIPENRIKPLGTAEAVQVALEQNLHLNGHSIVVCNGDNMPPESSFAEIFKEECAMLAYDASKLGLPDDRVSAFAVVSIDEAGCILDIIEKPTKEEIEKYTQEDGVVRVSMNTFRMPYSEMIEAVKNCPMSEVRNERELPVAVGLWVKSGGIMKAIPFAGEFLDLTHPSDFEFVLNKLQ
ncbi:MAG: hypothetical protein CL823_01330 [Crocinitomicaceae bacterium]|mgnify:CR=1 FL=1|nr:hypothetical protein [Crocinitomicaceae bacterium]|tara:strand:+ start:447 stop:2360 length:1914 start_codon:yes stop_codon:yes gene_type:complete